MAASRVPQWTSVLIADDDPSVLRSLAFALRASGYMVATAADGRAALDLVGRERFDLLLLDVVMPGATGWEVLARAQACTPLGETLPHAILITGYNDEFVLDMDLLQREGVGAMLLKPFTATLVLEEIERVLEMPAVRSLPRDQERKQA